MSPLKTALRTTIGAIGATALIAGCGGKAHIEDTPTVTTTEPVGELTYWEVGLDDALREACQEFDLPEPTFRVDSAEVSEQGRTALAGLAACLNGPMSTMTVRLVGHADVRGTEEYNQELGLERARSVKQVLTQNGVTDNRITVVSHGEAEATGTAESDRRVEVAPQGEMSAADRDAMMRRITIYGVRPVEADVTLEERGDPDGDGADEPETVVRPKAQGGGTTFEEQGDPDGDGADEPPKPVKAKPKSSR